MGTRLASGSPRFSPLAVPLRHFEERVPSQGLSEPHSSLRKAIYLPSRLPLPHYGWEAILCVLLRALGPVRHHFHGDLRSHAVVVLVFQGNVG